MKKNLLLMLALLCMVAQGPLFTSCSKDDNQTEKPLQKAYFASWNRCDALVRQCEERRGRLDEEERKRLADAGKRLAGKVEDLEKRAEALSGRIEQADSSEGLLAFGAEIADLRSSGADAFSALDEDVKALPNFSAAIASWSNRCDALVARCENRERDLKAEEDRIETENRRVAELKKEEAKRDRDACLDERAKIWRRLANENISKYRIDLFLDGVKKLKERLRGMETDEATNLAVRISVAEAGGFGRLCAVLEDAFAKPSFLWRFVAAPGVARAKARCGLATDPIQRGDLILLAFALNGIAALSDESEMPDADRWASFHSLVCDFADKAIDDAKKPPAWDDNVEALFHVANGTIPGENKKDARDCLDTYFSGWQSNPPKEAAADDDLKTVAGCSKRILAAWKEHPDAPDSIDRFALVIAGYETLLAYDQANYESAKSLLLFCLGEYSAAEQYFKILSPVSLKRMSGGGNDTAEGSR